MFRINICSHKPKRLINYLKYIKYIIVKDKNVKYRQTKRIKLCIFTVGVRPMYESISSSLASCPMDDDAWPNGCFVLGECCWPLGNGDRRLLLLLVVVVPATETPCCLSRFSLGANSLRSRSFRLSSVGSSLLRCDALNAIHCSTKSTGSVMLYVVHRSTPGRM